MTWAMPVATVLGAAAFAAGQVWLSSQLAAGVWGRTPALAVFAPAVLWTLTDLVVIALFVRALRNRARPAVSLALSLIACAIGTHSAWSGVQSFLQVV